MLESDDRRGDVFPALTAVRRTAACPFHSSLPDGVMVAQATLTRLVMVRIHVGQPICGANWVMNLEVTDVRAGDNSRTSERSRRERPMADQLAPSRPARCAVTVTSSAGSTGLATCV